MWFNMSTNKIAGSTVFIRSLAFVYARL